MSQSKDDQLRELEHWLVNLNSGHMHIPELHLLTEVESDLILRLPDPRFEPFPVVAVENFYQIARIPNYVPEHLRDYTTERVQEVRALILRALGIAVNGLLSFPLEKADTPELGVFMHLFGLGVKSIDKEDGALEKLFVECLAAVRS